MRPALVDDQVKATELNTDLQVKLQEVENDKQLDIGFAKEIRCLQNKEPTRGHTELPNPDCTVNQCSHIHRLLFVLSDNPSELSERVE
jgi:hypothetical protein